MSEETEETTYELDQEVIHVTHDGKEIPGVIIGLPEEGKSKYRVQLEDGSIYPINPCYLKPKE